MKLSIYSIQETIYQGEVQKIIAKTPSGDITVLEDHLPIITSVLGPEVRILDKENQEQVLSLGSGFLEVRPGSEVVVLANPE